MVAHSTGQYSTRGRSAMTIPPEWIPRWRGKPCTWRARSSTSGGMPGPSSALGRVRSPPASASASRSVQPSTDLATASAWPGESPQALAISRSAERGR